MSPTLTLVIGLAAGFALATLLMSSPGCCASLGAAALKKYDVPDLGQGIDSVFGGAISSLGLA